MLGGFRVLGGGLRVQVRVRVLCRVGWGGCCAGCQGWAVIGANQGRRGQPAEDGQGWGVLGVWDGPRRVQDTERCRVPEGRCRVLGRGLPERPL